MIKLNKSIKVRIGLLFLRLKKFLEGVPIIRLEIFQDLFEYNSYLKFQGYIILKFLIKKGLNKG